VTLTAAEWGSSVKLYRPNGGFGGSLATKLLDRHNQVIKGSTELPSLSGHLGGGKLIVKPALICGRFYILETARE